MKKTNLALGILSLAFIASCQNEEIYAPLQVEDKVEVLATLADASQTRTHHSDDHKKVLWSENDAISVFTVADEPCHDRYYLTQGVNTANAKFQWDKTFNGEITGGIEMDGSQTESYVGVYPFREGTSVKVMGNSYEINTVIPTTQKYAENSFGEESYVMVGVDLVNPKPAIPFKNVGTILIFQLNGEGTIQSATLKSAEKQIAGNAVVTVSEENGFIPSTDMKNGEYEITLSCGEGVQLKGEEYTKFCFVLAPGVYTDLVVKFTDVYGNFFEQNIENPNGKEMARSMSYNMPKMTFNADKTEDLNLWVKAIAPAYAQGERVVPSINDVNFSEWIKNLASYGEDIPGLITQVITSAKMGDYKAVYDLLGGIPGFVKETKTFEVTGVAKQELQYSYTQYIESLLGEIAAIDSADEFVAYVQKLSVKYQDFETELDESLGSVGSYLEKYLNGYNKLTDAEKLAVRKTTIIERIDEDINTLRGITDEKFLATAEEYIQTLTTLKSTVSNCTDNTALENAVKAVKLGYIRVEDGKTLFGTTNWKYLYGNRLTGGFNGVVVLGELIVKEEANNLLAEASKSELFNKIADIKITKYLVDNISNKEGLVYKTVSKLFDNPQFVATIQQTLTDLVKKYEDIENSMIDKENVSSKEEAIEITKGLVIGAAKENARYAIEELIKKENTANTENGPWGLFKRILAWDKCVNLFKEYNIIEVHTALENLCSIIDDLISYERVGSTQFTVADEDYILGEHYWVLQYDPEI